MIKVLIHSCAKKLKDGSKNPKDYIYFNELIEKLKNGIEIIEINQLGIKSNEKLNGIDNYFFDVELIDIKNLINEHNIWIAVDSFLPHYCNCYDLKPGIVIYTISDLKIFGYEQNLNLLKSREYIKQNFNYYKKEDFKEESHIDHEVIFKNIKNKIQE